LGGLLIAASIFMGGGDTDADFDADFDVDVDVDADLDVDADHDHDFDVEHDLLEGPQTSGGMAWWLPFLSMRFWTFASATFGGTGVLLSLLETSSTLTFAISAALGIIMGWSVAWMFHQLKKTTTVGEITTTSLQGAEATVMLAMGPGKQGKIRLLFDGSMVDLLANTDDEAVIPRGGRVLIVSAANGVAQVTRLRALDDPLRQLENENRRSKTRQTQEN